MARLIFPSTFLKQLELLADVKAKHDALAAASPLAAYLAQQDIDLAADSVAGAAALECDGNLRKRSAKKEINTEQRKLLFNPVWAHVKGSFAFLKTLYGRNFKEVGTWGAPIIGSGRINYPPGFMKRTLIFDQLLAKHKSFILPDVSPLQVYLTQHAVSLDDDNMAVQQAVQNHNDALRYSMQAEDARQDRDNLWKPVAAHLRGIGGFLVKLYSDNPSEAGEWGFTIDNSRRSPKLRTTKVKLKQKVSNKSVVIGGTFTNLGKVALIIYKGKKVSDTFLTVEPGMSITMPKGFSRITVVNNSSTMEGKFSVNSVY